MNEFDRINKLEADGVGDPLDYLVRNTRTMEDPYLSEEGVERETFAGYFPVNCTTTVIGNGGAGKTTWIVLQAMLALKADKTLEVMIVSKEDEHDDYKNKLHSALFTKGLQRPHPYEDIDKADIEGRFHVICLQEELVAMSEGRLAKQLVEYIKDCYPRVRLVFFETLSHLMGTQTESPEGMALIVTHCNIVAKGINGAAVITHHQAKHMVKEKAEDLMSGRGGSSLGLNTRSFVVLTRISEKGDAEDIIKVHHTRYSYGDELPDEYFALKDGCSFAKVFESRYETDVKSMEIRQARVERWLDGIANEITDWIRIMETQGKEPTRAYLTNFSIRLMNLKKSDWEPVIKHMLENDSFSFQETNGVFSLMRGN